MSRTLARRLNWIAFSIFCFSLPLYAAQEKATPPADEKQKPADSSKKSDEKPNAPVKENDQLSFEQQKVAAEMAELEERMFRLAESLSKLEPENSSRLRIALKYTREELLVQQMKETQGLLNKLKLNDASTEQKQIIAKLKHLHDLLLSADLDLQMKLEKLRLMREILRQVDVAIKEEDREKKESTEAAKLQDELKRLTRRKTDIQELIKQQQAHLDQTKKINESKANAAEKNKQLSKVERAQEGTQNATKALILDKNVGGDPASNLKNAEGDMGKAVNSLSKTESGEALKSQDSALANLKKEVENTEKQRAEIERKISNEKFQSMKGDQTSNRNATDNVAELTRKLGESGASALGEFLRASGSMSGAENKLGGQQAADAQDKQEEALKALKYGKQQLEDEMENLLESIRAEVHRRVIESLTLMLEKQTQVRESTERLLKAASKIGREELATFSRLATAEERIVGMADECIILVEETEFGVALPSALKVVKRQMTSVKSDLEKAKATKETVDQEKRVEDDLKSLLEAMKTMPSKGSGKPKRGKRQDQRQELMRLVAELKMIRLMQLRVNSETTEIDSQREKDLNKITATIKKSIDQNKNNQKDVHDTTDRLIEQRLQPPQ